MASNKSAFRPWLQHHNSSASLRGLEIAIPPGEIYPRPTQSLDNLYHNKELPPIPRKASSRRWEVSSRKMSDTYKVMFGDGPYAELYVKRNENDPYEDKLGQTRLPTDRSLNLYSPQMGSLGLKKERNILQETPQFVGPDETRVKYHQQWSDVESPTTWETDKGMRWSSSDSCYSNGDNDSRLASYRGSWSAINSVEDVSPETPQEAFYLQPKTYSANTTEIIPKASSAEQPSTAATSIKRSDRPPLAVEIEHTHPRYPHPQTDRLERVPIPPTPHRAMTLDNMISYERRRFEPEEFSPDSWHPPHSISFPGVLKASKTPERSQYPSESRYELIPTAVPRPLMLRQGDALTRESDSHFSDYSDNEESEKMFPQARLSVMSHIRKISTAKLPHEAGGKEKGVNLEAKKTEAPLVTVKRKRVFSNISHPPRSPYPRSTTPKQVGWLSAKHTQTRERQEAPISPPQSHACAPSLSRRLSSIIRKPSSDATSPPQSPLPQESLSQPKRPNVITNYAREASDPDTPLPGRVGLISTFSPILHKGKGVVAQVRQGVKVRSAAEKRRDKLRKKIVLIGPADQYPDGRVNSWF